mgnify:CR=1 FL=1
MLTNNSRQISDSILRLNKTTLTWDKVGRMRYPRTRHQGSIVQMTEELQKHAARKLAVIRSRHKAATTAREVPKPVLPEPTRYRPGLRSG